MNNEVDLKNLRTYEEDIKNALDNGNVTTTDIVLAEQKRRISVEKKEQASKLFTEAAPARPKNIPLIIGGVVFLLVGGAALYYAFTFGIPFFQKTMSPVTIITQTAPNPINPESVITLTTENKTLRDIVGNIREHLKKGSVTNRDGLVTFTITKDIDTVTDGITTTRTEVISTSDLFSILESRAPEALVRSFDQNFIIGAHQKDVPEPFILLKSESFEQSFAGMLAWEPNMVDDLRDIFFRNLGSSQRFPGEAPVIQNTTPTVINPVIIPATTSTSTVATNAASTTPSATSTIVAPPSIVVVQPTLTYNPRKFVDAVFLNKDVRAIQDFTGKTLFFYTFIDKQNLLITTNIQTLETVMRQLNIASLIR